MTKLLKTGAIGLSTVAALALAQPSVATPFGGASASAGAAASAAASAAGGAAAAAPGKRTQAQRYCGNTVQTASRIVRRECKTQEEWAHEGVDILSKK